MTDNRPGRAFWTDERKAEAKRRYLNGDSARTIAAALGAPSRSAVIGVLNRIGVQRSPVARQVSNVLGGGFTPRRGERAKAPRPPEPAPPSGTEPQAPAPVSVVVPLRPDPPGAQPCGLLGLTRACMCRWPLRGEGAETVFCAAAVEPGSVYCPPHRKISGAKARTPTEAERFARAAERLAEGRRRAAGARGSR